MSHESAQHFIRVISTDAAVLTNLNNHFKEIGIHFNRDTLAEAMQLIAEPQFAGIIAQAIFTTTSANAIDGRITSLVDTFPGIISVETGPYFED